MDNSNTLPRTDHDTLIRLETKFDTFSTQVISDIKELKDGTQQRLTELEQRTGVIEKVHNQINPLESSKNLLLLMEWRSNFQSNIKFLFLLSSLLGSILGFILSLLSVIFHLIHI